MIDGGGTPPYGLYPAAAWYIGFLLHLSYIHSATGLAEQLVLGDAAAFFQAGENEDDGSPSSNIYTDDATSSNRVVRWITTR